KSFGESMSISASDSRAALVKPKASGIRLETNANEVCEIRCLVQKQKQQEKKRCNSNLVPKESGVAQRFAISDNDASKRDAKNENRNDDGKRIRGTAEA